MPAPTDDQGYKGETRHKQSHGRKGTGDTDRSGVGHGRDQGGHKRSKAEAMLESCDCFSSLQLQNTTAAKTHAQLTGHGSSRLSQAGSRLSLLAPRKALALANSRHDAAVRRDLGQLTLGQHF